MTVGRSRAILGVFWIAGTAPIMLILSIQTIIGVYGEEWQLPWSWVSPLVFPNLSLIIAVWTIEEPNTPERVIRSRTLLITTMMLSVFYLINIYAVLLVGRYSDISIRDIMSASSWYLLPFQALVTGALGKFFIETKE
jgi:hypothetical protein